MLVTEYKVWSRSLS